MAQETPDGVPICDGFDFPVGARGDNADVYKTHKVDSILVDEGYFKSFSVWHPGEDWNGRGGGDTDLGDPIYAIAHGKVAGFGYYPQSWGNLVLIEHALPDNTRVWSQYAHLEKIMVNQVGQKVTRGQQIGTMGKGAKTDKFPQGRWIAHLHFEIRRNKLAIDNWIPMVRDKAAVLANYHNPTEFIKANRPSLFAKTAPAVAAPAPSLDQIVVDSGNSNPAMGTFRKANAPNWFTASQGFNGSSVWTYASAEGETNWGEWQPNLPAAGRWQVWTYIPPTNASTTYARYTIVHSDGRTEAPVNQGGNANSWVLLGTYRFPERGGAVRLSDVTGELSEGKTPLMIGFDAVCWVKAN